MITVLESWEPNVPHSHTDSYTHKTFRVVQVLGVKRICHRRDVSDDINNMRILVSKERLFDVIADAHEGSSHGRQRLTYKAVTKK